MKDLSDPTVAEKIIRFTVLDGKRVLEIGCGDGRVTRLLAGRPKELIAIEPDPERIGKPERRYPALTFVRARVSTWNSRMGCSIWSCLRDPFITTKTARPLFGKPPGC